MSRTRLLKPSELLGAFAGLLLACSQAEMSSEPGANHDWPEGTVLACDGEPISAVGVDRVAEALKPLGPKFTQPHLRRLALTNVCLPLAAGRAMGGPERRSEALRAAEEALRGLQSPSEELGVLAEGTQDILGIPLWDLLQDLEVGLWTGPWELPGQHVLVLLLNKDGNLRPQNEVFSARVVSFPYVDDPPSLAGEALQASLEVVEGSWETLVPGFWRHQMGRAEPAAD